MHPRAAELIELLDLKPHPEGGHYAEVFRSEREVQPLDGRPLRSALTTIYFLLMRGEWSRWHRVASDEVWHFYEGDPLELLVKRDDAVERVVLGVTSSDLRAACVVPANCWQAAKPLGEYTLVGCSVGPGFDFADFEMDVES